VLRKSSAVLALCAVVVACTASASAGTSAATLETVKVGFSPIADYAPLFVGLKLGLFKKQGLDVKVQNTFTSSGLVAATISGEVDIGTSSSTAMMTGIGNGLPVKMLAAGSAYFGTVQQGNTQILVKSTSSIQSFKDLVGKTVSTVNLQGLFQIGVWNAVEKSGGDPGTIKSLPTQQQDEANALAAGQVDAAVFQEPWLTLAKKQGGVRSIGNPFALLTPYTTAGVLIASNSTIQQKPATLRKFLVAWQQAVNIAQTKQKFTRQILVKYTGLTQDVANAISLPKFTTQIDPKVLSLMMGLMVKYGWIKERPSYDQLVWNKK
jgi:NitT/TauT family transport system substrate-binding protein